MYPEDIRHMAHMIILYAIVGGGCSLASVEPRLEFATRNEYQFWISEQATLQFIQLNVLGTGTWIVHPPKLDVDDILVIIQGRDQVSVNLIEAVKAKILEYPDRREELFDSLPLYHRIAPLLQSERDGLGIKFDMKRQLIPWLRAASSGISTPRSVLQAIGCYSSIVSENK
jgi:hypothetical protein